MKKILAMLMTLTMTVSLLSGCAGVPVAMNDSVKEEVAEVDGDSLKTGLSVVANLTAEGATAEAAGSAATDISIIAVTVSDSGVIESCAIDAIQGKVSFDAQGQLVTEVTEILSKNELGENYGMKAVSPIGKEWNEQAAAIAAYAEGKTIEELKNGAVDENGVVKDADLATSATIYLGSFISGIEDAVNNAKHLGASKGDQLVLTAISNGSGSSSADGEAAGKASVVSNIIAMTMDAGVITSAIIDAVQSNAEFGTDGSVAEDASGAVLSKNQLGEDYGLKQFSPIGKEWDEQTAAFCEYIKGKTAAEVTGIALTETTAPAEADLTSSVTIAVGDFMALVEKAASLAEAQKETVKTGYSLSATVEGASAGEADGTATTNISVVAVTVNEEGVIEDCIIDAIQGKVSFGADGQLTSETGEILSKNELGDAYGMKVASSIGKEWNEQVAAIAQYAVGKTVEELKNGAIDETGMIKDADLASSATLYAGGFISAIEAAVKNAENLGAASGDKLVLTNLSTSIGSKSASEEESGCAQVDANLAILTMKEDVITSAIIDAVQSKMNFDLTGAIEGEANSEVLSKNQLGENYGLKQFSPIGKEWNEQTAAFCEYVVGKTAAEVAGIALTETTAPAEADLASSVTIAVGDFMALIEKAAAVEKTSDAVEAPVKTGYSLTTTVEGANAGETDGTATTNISVVAVTVNEEGVIEDCIIDAIQGKVSFGADGQLTSETGEILSKNELGDAYGMKVASSIGKEWNEQVAAIAQYAVGKTVEELKNGAIDETGMIKDADLASSATLYAGGFISAIEAAVNNAEDLGAVSGDKLVLTNLATSIGSKSASEEEIGYAQVDANLAILTMNGDVITSCIIDSVQSKMNFDLTGVIEGEANIEVLSKNQLGENYGLKQFSPIGKEWNEQTAAFCEYVVGKTAEEVAGIALTETTAPAEADLASSVTIAVGDFMALIEKSAK